jgi:hypothetical protein
MLDAIERRDRFDFYDRLYFDANRNGDLTDDAHYDNLDGQFPRMEFPVVDTTVRAGDAELPYRFLLVFYDARRRSLHGVKMTDVVAGRRINGYLRGMCYYKSALKLSDRRLDLALIDMNANGRFDDLALGGGEEGDRIYMTDGRPPREDDIHWLSNQVVLDDGLNMLESDFAGGRLCLAPPSEPLYPLILPPNLTRLTLIEETSGRSLSILHPSERLMILPGCYRPVQYKMVKTDARGDRWVLLGQGDARTTATAVGPGQGGRARFGEPLVSGADISGSDPPRGKRMGTLSMSFKLSGSGGEAIDGPRNISRRNVRPVAPTWRLTDARGTELAGGKFRYG